MDPPKKPPLVSHLSDHEWRRKAETLYDSEMFTCSVGHPDPAFVYGEERGLFRF